MLTPEEKRQMAEDRLRAVVESQLRNVVRLCKAMRPDVGFLDKVQEANIGLIKGAIAWRDSGRSFQSPEFPRYAQMWMIKYLTDIKIKNGHII